MKKRSSKRNVKDFFLTVLVFFGIILVIFVPKFFIARHFEQLREEINAPFDFDAATSHFQQQEKQKRQDKTDEPIRPTNPEPHEAEPDFPPDPASLPRATTPNKKTDQGKAMIAAQLWIGVVFLILGGLLMTYNLQRFVRGRYRAELLTEGAMNGLMVFVRWCWAVIWAIGAILFFFGAVWLAWYTLSQ